MKKMGKRQEEMKKLGLGGGGYGNCAGQKANPSWAQCVPHPMQCVQQSADLADEATNAILDFPVKNPY